MTNTKVNYYERNYDWVSGANYRIDEYRKRPVEFVLSNFPPGASLSMKTVEGKFPFGNKFGWWEYQSEYTDFWRWYFNFGFITNEIKWAAVEQTEGNRDYAKADELRLLLRKPRLLQLELDLYLILTLGQIHFCTPGAKNAF